MMRWIRTLLLALVLLGCTEPRVTVGDGVLVIAKDQTASWVRNFNPLLPVGTSRYPSQGGIYEPLLIYNTLEGEYRPWLATSYAFADDALSLTFVVREGVSWSDGQPFTADDVAFTFELLRKHKALDLQGVWGFVESVRAQAGQVVYRFQRPFVVGLFFLAHQPIVPRHIWKDVDNPVTFANPTPVATGPFTEVASFKHQVYELGKNPNYWQPGLPKVERLRFPAFPSNDQSNIALINDEVDWAGTFVPAIDRIYVGTDPEHHGYWFPLVNGTVMLYPNHARPPFDDVRVRKAISLAIDRERLVRVAMYNYTRPANSTGLSDAYKGWHDEQAKAADWVDFDLARANRILDEAGYQRRGDTRVTPGGEPMNYRLGVVTGWSDWVRAAQLISHALAEVGIRASVDTSDFAAWFQRLRRGEFDLSLGWTIEGPTPHTFYRHLMAGDTLRAVGEGADNNWHRFKHGGVDALLRDFEKSDDRATQQVAATELQRAFAREAPTIPLFFNPSWGEYNSKRFVGFPTAGSPASKLTPNDLPECLLTLLALEPRKSGH